MSRPPEAFVLASANPDKAAEIADILATAGITVLPRPADVPDVAETGDTLEANARLKAEALMRATGHGAVADDTGLEVPALDGAPGVYSARYAGPDATYSANVSKLLRELAARPDAGGDRRARFVTVAMVAYPDGRSVHTVGAVDGRITESPRGEGGFGYDPVFVPDEGDGRTFAEMSSEEKHALSHRGRAFRALAATLSASATPPAGPR